MKGPLLNSVSGIKVKSIEVLNKEEGFVPARLWDQARKR